MADRLAEIKARLAYFNKYDDPYRAVGWMLDDLEYAMGEIERLRAAQMAVRAYMNEAFVILMQEQQRLLMEEVDRALAAEPQEAKP